MLLDTGVIMEIKCVCGKIFTKSFKNRVYCSTECRKTVNTKKSNERRKKNGFGQAECKFCNNTFTKKKRKSRFCSHKCASKASIRSSVIVEKRYFENIDSHEKAYWLGFIFADGYVTGNGKRLQICLSTKDECIIDDLIEALGGDKKDKKYYGPYKTSGKQVHYSIACEEMVKDLQKLGCTTKKSKTLRFPAIDKMLYEGFILGYYDGDGTEGTTLVSSGSFEFLSDIKKIMDIKFNILKREKCYYLSLGANLFRSMTKTNIGLKRKRYIR